MCLEDAVALGEEVAAADGIPAALLRFSERRYERCRFVVETAGTLSHWQTYPGNADAEHERVTADAFALLAQPF
jgi:2-polyprenyl-6-methoxyphenol hydroxylase-like FAD-dependent oxidoreductase